MNGENQGDLSTLQAQRDKHQAALSGVEEQISAIEQKAREEREESERKQRELARLQKSLTACHDSIAWADKRISDLRAVAHGQVGLLLEGKSEAFFTIKSTLQEISEWERELALFKEYEVSLPKEIEKLAAVSA